MKWLWENWDPDGYSWYWCKLKYASEQSQVWMAANLLGGFLQRWDPCRNNCFGTMLIMGEDKLGGMIIEGAMMFRGKDSIQEYKDDEMFEMTPIELSSVAEKKKLEAILAWGEYGLEGDLPGPCLDGKEFK